MSRSRTQALVIAGLALTVLLGVVAFVSRGHSAPSGGGSSNRGVSQILANSVFTIWFIVMAIGAVALIFALAQNRGRRDARNVRSRRFMLGIAVLILMVLLLTFGRRIPLFQAAQHGNSPKVFKAVNGHGKNRKLVATKLKHPRFEWPLAVAITGIAAAAVLTALLRAKARRDQLASEVALVREIRRVLDSTLDDLRREADPRKAVIAAYARMEQILAVHGLPRRPSEAPQEYMARVLTELQVTKPAVERLTELFARAKFSHHDVDPQMKDDAIAALVKLREQIRVIDESLVEKPTLSRRVPEPAR